METLFWVAALVAVVSTVRMVTGRDAVHALLYLVVSLLAVAVVFFTLGAPFVAALEVILYAGAIMVLFIFVVTMLNLGGGADERERRWLAPRVWIGPVLLASILAVELVDAVVRSAGGAAGPRVEIGPKAVALALFGRYQLGVELAGLLLLAALVGAFHLARERRPSAGAGSPEPGGRWS